jgi:hypothetical protein
MALPVTAGKTKIAGIKIHDTRMMRLMEVLLHGGTQLNGWQSPEIHQALLTTFGLSASTYTLTQLRYDLRKMKAHGLLERIGQAYCYRLSDKGTKAALMFILFHKRVCGPLAHSLFHHRPDETLKPASKIESAFHKADHAIQQVLDLRPTCRVKIVRDEFSKPAVLETRRAIPGSPAPSRGRRAGMLFLGWGSLRFHPPLR